VPGVALVGAGRWGPNLARNLRAVPAWDLRWVCDTELVRATRVADAVGARPTTDLAAVLDDAGVSTVVVATPATSHALVAATCLAAGRHVLVEKPLACSSRDAEALVELAARRELVLVCDHTYRYAAAATALHDLIMSGALGDVVSLHSVRTNASCGHADVDVFWDLAHHDLALCDLFFDGVAPIDAQATPSAYAEKARASAGTLEAVVRSARVRIEVDWDAGEKQRIIEVHGTRGRARWDDLAATPLTWSRPPEAEASRTPIELVEGGGEPLAAVVRELLAAVRGERPPWT
jgi:predicted dehydrogenase